jgi:hypothetical protein
MFHEEGMHDVAEFGYLFGAFQGIFLWSITFPSHLVVKAFLLSFVHLLPCDDLFDVVFLFSFFRYYRRRSDLSSMEIRIFHRGGQ